MIAYVFELIKEHDNNKKEEELKKKSK